MRKRDYYLLCLNSETIRFKRWALEAFTVSRKLPQWTIGDYPLALFTLPTGEYAFVNKDAEEGYTVIEDSVPNEPLFRPLEKLILNKRDLPNVYEDGLVTTYGNAYINAATLVYGFGDKVPFITGQIKIGSVESMIERRLRDYDDLTQDEIAARGPKAPLLVSEYKRFNEGVLNTVGLTQVCVPSATEKTMTVDPKLIARRDELLKEHAHELNDPVVISRIANELIKMDKAWMEGDPGQRFYIKDKSFAVVRLKTFIFQGISEGFGVSGDFIPKSLDEGWDIEKLPAMANQLRDGSFNRGAQTALGGEETKFNYRIFQNCTISEDDCGTRRGLYTTLTKDRAPHYVSNFIVLNGESLELTNDNIDQYIGQSVAVRSPIYCMTKGQDYCKKCMGMRIASTPSALSTYAADIGSIFLSLFMAAMHGKALNTAKLDLYKSIT